MKKQNNFSYTHATSWMSVLLIQWGVITGVLQSSITTWLIFTFFLAVLIISAAANHTPSGPDGK